MATRNGDKNEFGEVGFGAQNEYIYVYICICIYICICVCVCVCVSAIYIHLLSQEHRTLSEFPESCQRLDFTHTHAHLSLVQS